MVNLLFFTIHFIVMRRDTGKVWYAFLVDIEKIQAVKQLNDEWLLAHPFDAMALLMNNPRR
jgi:hypothetical protein